MATKKTTTPAPKKAVTKKATAKKVAPPPAKKAVAPKAKVGKDDFSVIETGGKQYIVSVGDVIEVELLGDHEEGDKVTFDKVLMNDTGSSATIGTPYIAGAAVKGTFQGVKKGKKLSIIRFKAKSNRDRRVGHRQKYAQVKIESL